MSQLLAFTERPDLMSLIELECKSQQLYSPIFHKSVNELKSMLDMFDLVDIVIIDEPSDAALFSSLLSIVTNKAKRIKNLFLLTDKETSLGNKLPKSNLEVLKTDLRKIVSANSALDGHISIPLDSMLHFKTLTFDLYTKEANGKMAVKIPAGKIINETVLVELWQAGHKEIWFERIYNREFSMLLIKNMIHKVQTEYKTFDEKIKATSEVVMTTSEIIHALGFKPRIVEVCESVVQRISDDVIKGKDQFAAYLNKLRAGDQRSFRLRLIELTGLVATQISDQLPNLMHADQTKKLIFASLFTDVHLKDDAHLHVRSAEDLAKLPKETQKEINEHAFKAAEMVASYPNAPMEAEKIIKQHHGSMTGVGFPKEISSQLHPLSKCLITAQEISFFILKDPSRPPSQIVRELQEKYKGTALEEYFGLFEKSTKGS